MKMSGFYGVTFVAGDQLEIVFLEALKDHVSVVGEEVVQITSDASQEEVKARLHQKIGSYLSRSPVWLHLIDRNSGFVKLFAVDKAAGKSEEAVLRERVREEMPHLADDIIYHVKMQRAEGSAGRGLMYGIAKSVLHEQLATLPRTQLTKHHLMRGHLSLYLLNPRILF